MDNTKCFNINVVGETSQKIFVGTFKVKRVLSRGERFLADERRRFILGANPESADIELSTEAAMLGQLFVRVLPNESPDFWKLSNAGLLFEDGNVIIAIFKEAMLAQKEYYEDIQKRADEATQRLAKDELVEKVEK